MRRWTIARVTAALLAASAAGCGPGVDLRNGLQVSTVASGWHDLGHDKVVPAFSFTLTNVSAQTLAVLQVNARFHSADEGNPWGEQFITVSGSRGLPSGATTDTLRVAAPHGYTGDGVQLMVGHFAPTTVEIVAKYGPEPWTRIGEFPIAGHILR
jgi:hypothetical protein